MGKTDKSGKKRIQMIKFNHFTSHFKFNNECIVIIYLTLDFLSGGAVASESKYLVR